MPYLETSITKVHKLYHLPVGEEVFVSAKPFGGLGSVIGYGTHLCEIKKFHVDSTSEPFIFYEVEIIDSPDPDLVGIRIFISHHSAFASKFQSRADGCGDWYLNRDEDVEHDLFLVKPVKNPDYAKVEDCGDLIHLISPHLAESYLVPRLDLQEHHITLLSKNIEELVEVDYDVVQAAPGTAKIRHWFFHFTQSSLYFSALAKQSVKVRHK